MLVPHYCREWSFSWSSSDRRCSNYIWVINNFFAYQDVAHIRGLAVVTMLCHNYPKIINKHSSLWEELQSDVTWVLMCSKLSVTVQRIVQADSKIDGKYQHYRHFVGISMSFIDFERDNGFYTSQLTKLHKVGIWIRLLSVFQQSIRFCVYTSAHNHNVKWINLKSHYALFVLYFKFEKQFLAKKLFLPFIRHVSSNIFPGNFFCETVATQFINQVNYRGLWVLLATHLGYSALIPGSTLQKYLLDNPCPQNRTWPR